MLGRVGENGELCDAPTAMSIGSGVNPLDLSWTTRPARNDMSHRQMFSANPKIRNVWTSLSRLILSKNPWISNCKGPQQPPKVWAPAMSCERETPPGLLELSRGV